MCRQKFTGSDVVIIGDGGLGHPHRQESIISSLINGLVCNKTDSDHMLLGRVDLVEVKHLRVVNYVQIDLYNNLQIEGCDG